MATKDTVVQELVVNTLTHKQFKAAQEAGTLSPYELYGTPDTSVRLPVLTPMWFDHLANDVSWLRADTFSWQSGDVYKAAHEHLASDYESIEKDILYAWNWTMGDEIVYTKTSNPSVGDVLYNSNGDVLSYSIVEMNDGTMYINESSAGGRATRQMSSDIDLTIKTDTIGDITISYYLAEDGHKICLPDQESNISALYESTGVAWYYILDTDNKRFKLPRSKHNKYADTVSVVGTGKPIGFTPVNKAFSGNKALYPNSGAVGETTTVYQANTAAGLGLSTDPSRSQVFAQQAQDTDQYKYLYFYVGNFGQTAVEQTAGVTTETLNGKADIDLGNLPTNIDYVVESQEPTSSNSYTWYRKYKSGWVEQGGYYNTAFVGSKTFSFPVTMANTGYTLTTGIGCSDIGNMHGQAWIESKSTTGFAFRPRSIAGNFTVNNFSWYVAGYAAE